MAMTSRGFNGDVKVMQQFKMRNLDYFAVAASISLGVLLVLISHDFIKV
jgi:cobalt/nickel transport system permease protein